MISRLRWPLRKRQSVVESGTEKQVGPETTRNPSSKAATSAASEEDQGESVLPGNMNESVAVPSPLLLASANPKTLRSTSNPASLPTPQVRPSQENHDASARKARWKIPRSAGWRLLLAFFGVILIILVVGISVTVTRKTHVPVSSDQSQMQSQANDSRVGSAGDDEGQQSGSSASLVASPVVGRPTVSTSVPTSTPAVPGMLPIVPQSVPQTTTVQSNPATAIVNLGYATYQGRRLANGVNEYLGMRFAAPPMGDLRWRAPKEPLPETNGVVDATKFGKICLGISASLPSESMGEDCLFANVWAPADVTVDSKLPVWLFTQGYTLNSNANWNGSAVLEQSGRQIVFVNFNYRVGMWGFLASERLRANGDLNVGLLDQRMMMTWVKNHIAQFGGDPDHVVLHGASAGAGSVALHLVAYNGRNDKLFTAAIGESIFFPTQPRVSELEWQFDRLASATGCVNTAKGRRRQALDQVACLRNLPVETLQKANVPSPYPGRTTMPTPLFYWTPCVDGVYLMDLPQTMFEQGRFVRVPVLFGNDEDEGSFFGYNAASPDEISNFLANNYPQLGSNQLSTILSMYPLTQYPSVPNHNSWFPVAAASYGEATFICPSIHLLDTYSAAYFSTPAAFLSPAQIHAQRQNQATRPISSKLSMRADAGAAAPIAPPIWAYHYNVSDQQNTALGLGVVHLWESWAVFGPDSLGGPGRAPPSYYTYNAGLVPVVMDYWISFVRALDPNVFRNAAAPVWEPWLGGSTTGPVDGNAGAMAAAAAGGKKWMVFQTESTTMGTAPDDQLGRCETWRNLATFTEQK